MGIVPEILCFDTNVKPYEPTNFAAFALVTISVSVSGTSAMPR